MAERAGRRHHDHVRRLRAHRRFLHQLPPFEAGEEIDTMTMFAGFGHIVDFFTSFEWWKADPHDELVSGGAYCLAKPGEIYAVYLPREDSVTVRLEPGTYTAHWFGASTGEILPLPPASGPQWVYTGRKSTRLNSS